MNSKVCVRVPASTANLGPGFDCLGMALNLYAWLEMEYADRTTIRLIGDNVQGLPEDKSNLIYQVAQQVFARAGLPERELSISMYSDIPLTRGLGSSASAIVAALAAANALIGHRLSNDELFQIATQIENHPDNVGASLFGGIVAAMWDGKRASHVRLEPPEHLEVLVVIPEYELSTKHARAVLPGEVSLQDAVYNLSHSSVLVAALATGRLDLIREAMRDRLHQPYRASLVPGMTHILEHATERGALGVALSGAGPTLLALVDARSGRNDDLEAFMIDTLRASGIPARTMWLKPEGRGVAILTPDDKSCTFIEKLKGELQA
jgi:homoserine kinase